MVRRNRPKKQTAQTDVRQVKPAELGETGEEVLTDKSLAIRQKRKLTQMAENDSPKRKKRQMTTIISSRMSPVRVGPSKVSVQNTKQARGYQTRCRSRNGLHTQQSTGAVPEDMIESDVKPPTGKKLTRKNLVGDSSGVASSAVNRSVKKTCKPQVGEAVEKEIKPESGSALNTTNGAKKLVGAHCSIAGGLHKAVEEAVAMGGCAFGLFLKSQRTWSSTPLDPQAAEKFRVSCKEHGFMPNTILPHGSYLMNCGSPNPETLKKSRDSLLDELQRCEALGLTLFNFHPGSTCGEISVDECLDSIAEAINWAHQHTKFVITVVENMSCQGNTIGGRFEELRGIIDRVKDKSRIGVCLDTCHAFAAGYDLSSKQGFEKFTSDFDSIVGFQYLKAMHLNDSKGAVGCHLDRHENIGKGKIGLEGFRRVMTDPRFDGIPMILETPLGDYAKEIKLLNTLM